ncbi:hypothetical protein ACVIYL_004606 [Bradyrhizobium sp. USDA 3315]
MDGWIITVAVFNERGDDEEFRHITYVVAVADPGEAVRMTIAESGAKAAMLNCPIEEEQLQRIGVKPGDLKVVHDTGLIQSSHAIGVISSRLISFNRVGSTTMSCSEAARAVSWRAYDSASLCPL